MQAVARVKQDARTGSNCRGDKAGQLPKRADVQTNDFILCISVISSVIPGNQVNHEIRKPGRAEKDLPACTRKQVFEMTG